MCTISWKKNEVNLEKENLPQGYCSHSQGRLYIVGIGPGNTSLLTQKAQKIIEESQVVIGYGTYIRLIDNLIKDKEVISYGMTQEVERAKYAIKRALSGDNVSLISDGDPGIYGMAGVVLQLLDKEENKIKIEIIPGITAASSCAALLGAPLMHDFVVISLSDILTDSKLIEQRIELATRGDFVIVFYNPKSKKRIRPLKRAWEILMEYRSRNTIVGIVRNAQRENEEVVITTLKNMLLLKKIDMGTVLIVGNSKTYTKGKFMITPRGYKFRGYQEPATKN